MDTFDNLKLFEQREKQHKEIMQHNAKLFALFEQQTADIAFLKKVIDRISPAKNYPSVAIVSN